VAWSSVEPATRKSSSPATAARPLYGQSRRVRKLEGDASIRSDRDLMRENQGRDCALKVRKAPGSTRWMNCSVETVRVETAVARRPRRSARCMPAGACRCSGGSDRVSPPRSNASSRRHRVIAADSARWQGLEGRSCRSVGFPVGKFRHRLPDRCGPLRRNCRCGPRERIYEETYRTVSCGHEIARRMLHGIGLPEEARASGGSMARIAGAVPT